MGGAFTWYMMRQPAQLQILVNHQTESLLQSQKYLNESLKEKTLLLKEIHHRVKNNLQVISSLLNIQASLIADPRAREGYADSTRRIRSMALVHERLYHTGNLSHIDFREYLNAVAHDLGSSLYRSGVSLQVEAEPIMLGIDTAIPCGLMVNELVSNALKHAFPSEMPGVVSVSFKRINNLMLQLRVEDNGVGIPPEKDWRSLNSMGLNIIRTLAGQISGTITYDGNSGTRFTIEFPLDERPEEKS
jgi:two-component sensor histidine kinase